MEINAKPLAIWKNEEKIKRRKNWEFHNNVKWFRECKMISSDKRWWCTLTNLPLAICHYTQHEITKFVAFRFLLIVSFSPFIPFILFVYALAFGIILTSKQPTVMRVLHASCFIPVWCPFAYKCTFITLLSYDQVNWPALSVEWIFAVVVLVGVLFWSFC